MLGNNQVVNLKKSIRGALEESEFKNDIVELSLFGSYAYGRPTSKSDVDLLVEFRPSATIGLFDFFRIENYFKDKLKKKVDLVSKKALSKFFKKAVLDNAQLIYEGK